MTASRVNARYARDWPQAESWRVARGRASKDSSHGRAAQVCTSEKMKKRLQSLQTEGVSALTVRIPMT
eukprot:5759616-Prymnesium_polylepis.1